VVFLLSYCGVLNTAELLKVNDKSSGQIQDPSGSLGAIQEVEETGSTEYFFAILKRRPRDSFSLLLLH
jgi:hypothetical protein